MSCRFNKIVCVTQHIESCLRMHFNRRYRSSSNTKRVNAGDIIETERTIELNLIFYTRKSFIASFHFNLYINIYYRNVRIGFILCIENRDISSRHLRQQHSARIRKISLKEKSEMSENWSNRRSKMVNWLSNNTICEMHRNHLNAIDKWTKVCVREREKTNTKWTNKYDTQNSTYPVLERPIFVLHTFAHLVCIT